jgi:integrase
MGPIKRTPTRFRLLYPDEDKQVLSSNDVDIEHLWLWGFLAREGCRISEALALKWRDIDTERAVINLDRNKTRSPRTWRLGQNVARARHEKRRRDCGEAGDRVFHVTLNENSAAKQFRRDLKAAGITRGELYERTPERSPIRAHDLRGSFVTLALAMGKTEAWVMDRTGHVTSWMLNRYGRQARFASELGLGWFALMDELLSGPGHGRADSEGNSDKNGAVRESIAFPVCWHPLGAPVGQYC